MESYFVGLDVHSRESVFAIQQSDGTVVSRGSFPTSPSGLVRLRDDHRLPTGTPVALESGTSAFFVARELARLGLRPVIIDAHEVRRKANRPLQKSDRRDALELCDGISHGLYRSVVHVPERAISELRTTLSRRRHFLRTQTAEVNAAKRLLRSEGWQGNQHRSSLRTEAGWDRLLRATGEMPELQGHLGRHFAVWREAAEQVRALDQALGMQARQWREEVRRLQTVPGVGPIVALTAIAVFADVSRFPSAKHVGSYIGLVPSTHQSGSRDSHGRITKRGSAELRSMLCEAAHHARRPTHPLNPYFARLCTKHGYKRAIVAVAHRLGRILFAMLRDGIDFNPEAAGVELGPFTRTFSRTYRLTPKGPGRLSHR
jgi:transposase